MSLRAFLAGCWSGHDQINERDAENRLIRRCVNCGHTDVVLGQVVKLDGPQATARPVLGVPTGRVTIERKRVARFERKAGER